MASYPIMKNKKNKKGGVYKIMANKEYREWQNGWSKWYEDKIRAHNSKPEKGKKELASWANDIKIKA